MRHFRPWMGFLAYLLIAVFTFGYAEAREQRWENTNCVWQQGASNILTMPSACGTITAVAVPAAIFWPLYWSYVVQQ